MNLSYQHANPAGGNESFLLRFQDDSTDGGDDCVLVDAGSEIELDRLLDPADRLVAICLTHAHLDHYQSLEECVRDETTVLASPPTAAMLDDVFDVAARDYDVQTTDATVRRIDPIDGWTELTPTVDVHPTPAGHVPGAVGYLFRFDDGSETNHVLATGDFTRRRAAGYPGFDPTSFLDIDVLFLTVATDDSFEENLSRGLGRALQRAHSGARTLVATSGVFGVHVAYLLAELAAELDCEVPIQVVGQVAKLYETLDYECRHVESIPFFDDPRDCLRRGGITIAGPEVPRERSSGRLFGLLREDPSACVVQLLGSGEDPIREAQCTIHAHRTQNHPTRETLEAVHEEIDPQHTIVTHRHRGAGTEFNHLDGYIWSPTDTQVYDLYEDGAWLSPPWMAGDPSRNTAPEQRLGQQVAGDVIGALSLPDLERCETADLAAEGVDLGLVQEIVSQRTAYTTTETQENQADTANRAEQPTAATDPDTPTMASDQTETADETESPTTYPLESETLFDTTSFGSDDVDPRIVAAIEAGEISVEDLSRILSMGDGEVQPPSGDAETSAEAASEASDAAPAEPEEPEVPDEAEEPPAGPDERADPTPTPAEPEGSEEPDEPEVPDEPEEAPVEPDERDDSTSAPAEDEPDETDAAPTQPECEASDSGTAEEPSATSAQGDPSPDTDASGHSGSVSVGTSPIEMTLDPLTVALAADGVERTDEATVGEFVRVAVREYLQSLLAGRTTAPTALESEITIEADSGLQSALSVVIDTSDDYGNITELVRAGTAEAIAPGADRTLSIPGLEPHLGSIDAAVENDANGVTSREDFVTVAIRQRVSNL